MIRDGLISQRSSCQPVPVACRFPKLILHAVNSAVPSWSCCLCLLGRSRRRACLRLLATGMLDIYCAEKSAYWTGKAVHLKLSEHAPFCTVPQSSDCPNRGSWQVGRQSSATEMKNVEAVLQEQWQSVVKIPGSSFHVQRGKQVRGRESERRTGHSIPFPCEHCTLETVRTIIGPRTRPWHPTYRYRGEWDWGRVPCHGPDSAGFGDAHCLSSASTAATTIGKRF
ncbi:hypothetical protein VTI74DRAFT_10755 [Chaetomium olivicolor]